MGTEMPTLTEHIIAMYYNTVPLNADEDPYVKKHACLLNLTNQLMSVKRADEESSRMSSSKGFTDVSAIKKQEEQTNAYRKEYERCIKVLKM
jgi:hypothetical protein